MRLINKSLLTFLIILSGVFLMSCVSEMLMEDIPDDPPQAGKSVYLAIRVPPKSISTYSTEAGSADESHIDTLFVRILENGIPILSQSYFGTSLQDLSAPNDSTLFVDFELENVTGGTLTAEAFANRTKVIPVTSEIPLPDKNDSETWFMMSGSTTLISNGIAYSGTVHLERHVAKLRICIYKHQACIPEDLVIDYSHIMVEVFQVPDRTQLMTPPPIITPVGLTYIANYASHTGATLRPETPIVSFNGGQIDSLYLNENYLNNGDYNALNTTLIKLTIPSREPGKPTKTAEYTYQLQTGDGYQIKRNHIYVLNIQVAGQSLDPFVSVDMLPWSDVDMSGDIHGVFLHLDHSTAFLSPVDTENDRIYYQTDNSSIQLDWSKINPAHHIDTSVEYIQGMNGQIRFSWTNDGAPDFSFVDTLYVIAGNIVKAIALEYNVPAGNFGDWVGAFYRWNQTGERIIKIRNTGTWTATVTQGASFIRLCGEATKDPHYGSASGTLGNDAGFDANYPVTGAATALSGHGIIYFRIGIAEALAYIGAPPRYGVIEITTDAGIRKIYVRQGEEADYVMRPEDPNPANANNPRPYAVRYVPFNLSDPYRGAGGGTLSLHNEWPLGFSNSSKKFTDYPTQAGYFFQWNQGSAYKAFHPVNTVSAITGWPTDTKNSWERLLDPCPPGYRHPNDSLRSVLSSEIRQSWYATPNNDTYGLSHPSDAFLENSIWGFYADGLFDRLPVGASPNNAPSSTVSYNPTNLFAVSNTEVGYAGLLIFNPVSNSSLFLPAPGIRESVTGGALLNTGALGAYWTNSPNGTNAWSFYFTPTTFYSYNNAHQSNGASIRCIKTDFGLPGSN